MKRIVYVPRVLAAAVLAAAVLLVVGVVRAEPAPNSNEALAQGLFDTGRALLDRGDYARACPLFAESYRLDPAGGALMNLALCREKEGRLGDAWMTYQEGLARALADKRDDRAAIARRRMAVLEPRVPTLIVRLASPGRVELDGRALTEAEVTARLPLDPGMHEVRWLVPGSAVRVWRGRFAEGERREITDVDFAPVAQPDAPSRAGTPTAPGSALGADTQSPGWALGGDGTRARGGATLSPASKLVFVGAATALAASGVMALVAVRQQSDFESSCVPSRNYCSSGVAGHESARSWATASTVLLGAAVGLAALGFLLPRVAHPPLTAGGLTLRF